VLSELRLQLVVQGVLVMAVVGAATYLGAIGVLDSDALAVLFGSAIGAVGTASAVQASHQLNGTQAPGTITTTTVPPREEK